MFHLTPFPRRKAKAGNDWEPGLAELEQANANDPLWTCHIGPQGLRLPKIDLQRRFQPRPSFRYTASDDQPFRMQ